MFTVILIFHVVVSLALILVILMQSSKGEGLAGSAFGGSGLSGAVFGGRGAASFLSRATTILAILFMLNSGALALMSSGNRGAFQTGAPGQVESVVTQEAQRERERSIQQQQEQQGQTPAESLQVPPMDISVPKSPDTGGK